MLHYTHIFASLFTTSLERRNSLSRLFQAGKPSQITYRFDFGPSEAVRHQKRNATVYAAGALAMFREKIKGQVPQDKLRLDVVEHTPDIAAQIVRNEL